MLANFHAALYGFDQVKVSYIFFFSFLFALLAPSPVGTGGNIDGHSVGDQNLGPL